MDLEQACEALPIFPLPRTVLMPGALLPLHVFEPRYRALVAHCLEHDCVFGLATLRPGYEGDYDGVPAVYPELGLGRLVGHQPLPDGRSNVMVQYEAHATFLEDVESAEDFRVVRAQLERDDRAELGPAVADLVMLVLQLGALSPDAAREAARLVELSGMEMTDALARKLLEDPDARRAYLALTRCVDRVRVVQQCLAGFLAMAAPVAHS